MIENITLKYTSKHIPNDYKYVARDNDGKKRQLLPKEVKFTDGLNLVIGENGCGKSTLLKLITDMCFVHGLSTQGNFWDIINRVFPKSDWLNHDYSVVQDFVQISKLMLEEYVNSLSEHNINFSYMHNDGRDRCSI